MCSDSADTRFEQLPCSSVHIFSKPRIQKNTASLGILRAVSNTKHTQENKTIKSGKIISKFPFKIGKIYITAHNILNTMRDATAKDHCNLSHRRNCQLYRDF